MTDKNPITGDLLQSRMNSKEFEENFDRIFRSEEKALKKLEKSIKKHSELYANLAEYELHPSTGDVQTHSIFNICCSSHKTIYYLKN